MLICGFEKFDNFYVRIDILERLFLKIIETDKNSNNEIKLTADMLNLLGCSKENFNKLIKKMGYKIIEKNNEVFFKYIQPKRVNKSPFTNKKNTDNPFKVLENMRFD